MNIRPYLPSKKIQIVIAIVLLLAIAFGVYSLIKNKQTKDQEQAYIDVSYVNDETLDIYTKDSDNDGAYDWEEALWPELDPNNPDSDGDGVLDGKYIESKRRIQDRNRRDNPLPESNLTETQKLGRSVLTALMAAAQTDGDEDLASDPEFQKNISSYISDLTFGDDIYTKDRFKRVYDNKENSYAYRDRMKNLFRKYPVATSDIKLLIQAVENPKEHQGELRAASKKYTAYLSELVSSEVPYAIAGRHTELTNNISQIDAAIKNFLTEEPDELISLSLIIQLEKIMNQTVDAIVKINTYFDIIKDPSVFEMN